MVSVAEGLYNVADYYVPQGLGLDGVTWFTDKDRESREVPIGRRQRGAVLDGERGQMGVADHRSRGVPVDKGLAEQRPALLTRFASTSLTRAPSSRYHRRSRQSPRRLPADPDILL